MVRQSELDAARRGALTKLKNTGRVQAQILARFHHLDPSSDRFGVISVDGGPQMRVPVAPGKYVPDSIVVVLIDAAGKPVQVLAPRTDRPEGAADGAVFGAETAWKAIAPRELTPEEAQAIQDTADGLAEAQSDLADMAEYAGEEFSRLDTALDGLAAGVNGVTYSTEEPSEPGRNEGDTWFQMDGDGTAGFWRWNGTEWQPTEFEDTVLGDVTLGKLRAGSVIVDEGVIGKLWADGIAARSATFSRATITARNMVPGVETLATYGGISAEDRNILPLREFGVSTVHPSIWLQGRKSGWIHAQIPIRAGERYRFSVDVQGSVPGTMFFVQTRRANADGSMDESFSGWTDWQGPGAGSYLMNNVTVPGTGWNSYASEATATHDAVISLYVYANHENGAPNSEGYQWFRNLRMEAMQDGSLWVDGVVNARHLNIVPEQGAGGMELLPPGIRIIPSDAEAGTAVSLRTDEENWIAFAKAGKSTFSVNPDGHLTAQQVDANESLTYRGNELAEILDRYPRGVIARGGMADVLVNPGTTAGRIVAVTFRTPPDNRTVSATFLGSISDGGVRRGKLQLRQAEGDSVGPTNSVRATWSFATAWAETIGGTTTKTVEEWGWPYDATITLGVFANSETTGETLSFAGGFPQHLIIRDEGPPVPLKNHAPWVPSSGGGSGGGNETEPGTRGYTYQRKSSWVRSFLGNNNHYNYGAGRAYQGLQPRTSNGNLKSMIGWPSLISTLDGADIESIKIRIKNSHSYANSGATAYIGLHGRTSAPATFALSVADVIVASFTRSQTRTLTIPKAYHAGFKNGDYTGIVLYTSVSSNARYGYWDGTNTELIIEYEK